MKTISVIGAGTMGHGIAELAAVSGYKVKLYDINDEAVGKGFEQIVWSLKKLAEKGMINQDMADAAAGQISTTTDLTEAATDADIIIEAAPENLALKRDIFKTLEAAAPPHAILGTNTSSLPISQIAEAVSTPKRVVGLHFFNPPMLMTLIEIIKGEHTSDETIEACVEFGKSLRKTPVVCHKDVRGFITSRTFEGFIGEPMWLISRGEAEVRAIDARMKVEGFPMGPFELADLTGLDIGYNIRREAGGKNPPSLEEKINAGHYGRKTGRGFYDYADGKGPDYADEDPSKFDPLPIYAMMANIAAGLVEVGAAPPADIDLAMRLGGGFPKGPLAKADEIGLDIIVDHLQSNLDKHGDERYQPAQILLEKVNQGELGEKSGQGFFSYRD